MMDHDPHDRPVTEELPAELGSLDESSVDVVRAFRNAAHLHRQFMIRRFGRSDVRPGQGICFNVLLRSDGMTQRDLAQTMHISAPTLSRMLRRMEKAGFVERRADEADQRLTRVYLSDAGRALAGQARAALADHVAVAMAALTPAERRELADLLDKLSAGVASSLAEEDKSAADAASFSAESGKTQPDHLAQEGDAASAAGDVARGSGGASAAGDDVDNGSEAAG